MSNCELCHVDAYSSTPDVNNNVTSDVSSNNVDELDCDPSQLASDVTPVDTSGGDERVPVQPDDHCDRDQLAPAELINVHNVRDDIEMIVDIYLLIDKARIMLHSVLW